MKLIRFGQVGEEKPGIELNGKYFDCSAHFEDWNGDFFKNDGWNKLRLLIADPNQALPEVPEEARLGSPIARPNMIICVGLNYSDHAKESGMELPKEPIVFMKATNTMVGPNDTVTLPKGHSKVDWEVELGVVIGKDALYLENEAAVEAHIAGYCAVHDISERAFQLERGGQWVKGKSCPSFNPVGPYLVQKENIADVSNLNLQLKVNGELMQNGNTKNMIFSPTYIVWYLSQFMKLEAGDLISTGTPPGVGMGQNPPQYLKDGDVVELSVEGLGSQKQTFVSYQ
ncbi:MAG: fumarylacetoacetate hydrolase family protein [Bacteroidota bacterium]